MNRALNEKLEAIKHSLEEAAEIPVAKLPAAQKKLLKKAGLKAVAAHSGMSGYIVECKPGTGRLTKELLQPLVRSKIFRWIEGRPENIVIGF